jgi:hypothetical protein
MEPFVPEEPLPADFRPLPTEEPSAASSVQAGDEAASSLTARTEHTAARLSASARRRRARRAALFPGEDERAQLLNRLARRAFPTLDFFLFSFLCGAILGAGYLLDSQSLLLLGILLVPLLMPWLGVTLAGATGAWRFFFQSLAALLVGAGLVFIPSVVAGFAARLWLPLPLVQANLHARLWWPDLFVLALGAVLLVLSFVRSEEKPFLPGIMLVYELYLPLSAGAFGLGAGLASLWPAGVLVSCAHLALAILLGSLTFFLVRFRPIRATGYLLGALVWLAALVVAVGIMSGRAVVFLPATSRPTPTAAPPTPLPTFTPPPTLPATATSTPTPRPSPTSSPTPTFTPTPLYARVYVVPGDGALLRSEPGSKGVVITSLLNGYLVQILPESVTVDNVVWVRVYVPDLDVSGWMQRNALATATPSPP